MDLARLMQSMIRAEIDLFDLVDQRLRTEAGLLLTELLPLRAIAQTTDCRVQDLADVIGYTVGGASKTVDRLDARGWVRRRAHPDDRRSSIIALTPEGEAAKDTGDAVAAAVMAERFDTLSSADVARFDAVLARLDPTR